MPAMVMERNPGTEMPHIMCPERRNVEKRRILPRGFAVEFDKESFLRLSLHTFVSPKMLRTDEGSGNNEYRILNIEGGGTSIFFMGIPVILSLKILPSNTMLFVPFTEACLKIELK